MSSKEATIVVPVHNEAGTVRVLVDALAAAFGDVAIAVLFVDDGSKDETWHNIQQTAETYPFVSGLRFSRNFGKESAVFAGLENAQGDCVIVMDGDMQHPPETAFAMYRLWAECGVSIVEAVKNNRQKESLPHKVFAHLFYGLLHVSAGIALKNMSDFKLLDKQVVDILRRMPERYTFFRAMAGWTGFETAYVYFDVAPRTVGQTKFKPLSLTRLAVGSITSYSAAPLQIVTLVGVGFILFAVILAVQTLYMKLTGRSVEGFTTVILLLLLVGGILMTSLGIIGVYIAKIYDEVKMRPRYIVSQTLRAKDGGA